MEHITTIIIELRRQRTIIRAVLGFAEGRGWVERNLALNNIEELKIRQVVTSNPAIERPARKPAVYLPRMFFNAAVWLAGSFTLDITSMMVIF